MDIYKINLMEYFVTYFINYNYNFHNSEDTRYFSEEAGRNLLSIITRLMYHDTENVQEMLKETLEKDSLRNKYFDIDMIFSPNTRDDLGDNLSFKIEEDESDTQPTLLDGIFFDNMRNFMDSSFTILYVGVKGYSSNKFLDVMKLAKITVQFLKNIAEGFNTNFNEKIFNMKAKGAKVTLFDTGFNHLIKSLNMIRKADTEDFEYPNDKLVIIIYYLIEFLMEHIERK